MVSGGNVSEGVAGGEAEDEVEHPITLSLRLAGLALDVWCLGRLGLGEWRELEVLLAGAGGPEWQLSLSQVGYALRNLFLNAATWALSLVLTASASLVLSEGPNLFSASLKRAISLSPHFVRAEEVPWRASVSAASQARWALACSMCCSRMCMEHERVDGNVRGQYGHHFSFDPAIATGGTAAPCVRQKWQDVDFRLA